MFEDNHDFGDCYTPPNYDKEAIERYKQMIAQLELLVKDAYVEGQRDADHRHTQMEEGNYPEEIEEMWMRSSVFSKLDEVINPKTVAVKMGGRKYNIDRRR